jgi:trimethylamine--corrinoid protein Co-methyltransferase
MDPRNGEDLYYTLDKVLWKAAGVQLGKEYGLPTAAECGGAMSWRCDLQAGAEGVLFMLAAQHSGAHLLSGIGSYCNAVGMSGEMMLVQTAWLKVARFLGAGLDTQTHLGLESIARVGPGGHFLADDLTLELLRSAEFFDDELFACEGPEAEPMLARAHRRVEELAADFDSPLPGQVQEELRRFFREEYARLENVR